MGMQFNIQIKAERVCFGAEVTVLAGTQLQMVLSTYWQSGSLGRRKREHQVSEVTVYVHTTPALSLFGRLDLDKGKEEQYVSICLICL